MIPWNILLTALLSSVLLLNTPDADPGDANDEGDDQNDGDQEPQGLAGLDDDALMDTAGEVLRHVNPEAFDRVTDAEDLAGITPEDIEVLRGVSPGVADELAGRQTTAKEAADKTAAEAAAAAKKLEDEEEAAKRLAEETPEQKAARLSQELRDQVRTEHVPTLKQRLDDLAKTPAYPPKGSPPGTQTWQEKYDALQADLAPVEQLADVMGRPDENPALKLDTWERTDPLVREQAVQIFGIVPPFNLDVDGEPYGTSLQKHVEKSAETVKWARDARRTR